MNSVESGAEVRLVTPNDVRRLHVSRWSTTSLQRLIEIVTAFPHRSVWNPASGDYAIVNGWRHRPEIAHLFELAAPRDPVAVVQSAIAAARDDGAQLFITVETDSTRRPAFYERLGLSLMEEVISLEHPDPKPREQRVDDIRPLGDLDQTTLDQIVALDHAAFPWIWRNSTREFRTYVEEPGVELYGVVLGGRIVAYIGFTAFLGWGHIDRVAVDQDHQGQGLGLKLTRFAIDRLVRVGARRIGLSTQASNVPARGMYEKLGFVRQLATDYRLYGRWIDERAREQHERR